ncbi:hypothetical protein SAMN06309944_2183 [Micrococcales bacterium KH10]|nr:hypothetical protein SAMN06309944_2183 [Micrococcales bacterium KH10]
MADNKSAEAEPVTNQAPRALRVLSVLLWVQAVSFLAAGGFGLWATLADDVATDATMYGLLAVALLLAVFFGLMARAARQQKSWFRGPAITLELLITISLLSTWSAFTPTIPSLAVALALATLVLLFLPTVLQATTSQARLQGAYPETEPD